jgi:hypothetical protein
LDRSRYEPFDPIDLKSCLERLPIPLRNRVKSEGYASFYLPVPLVSFARYIQKSFNNSLGNIPSKQFITKGGLTFKMSLFGPPDNKYDLYYRIDIDVQGGRTIIVLFNLEREAGVDSTGVLISSRHMIMDWSDLIEQLYYKIMEDEANIG